MSSFKEYGIIFLMGGVIYSMIEVIARGYTHWSMTLTAGIALMIMYRHYKEHMGEGLLEKCLFGAVTITLCELISGIILNIILRWDIWDYSGMYMNFLGQICPTFTCGWFLLSAPASGICSLVRKRAEESKAAA